MKNVLKTTAFALLTCCLFTTATHAQKFQLGVKAGTNISNFNNTDWETESLVGFYGGGFIAFYLGDRFAIQPELLFSSQGAKVKDVSGNENKYKVNYITIPVMAKFRFGGLYVEGGPQFGFKAGEDIPSGSGFDDFAKSTDLAVAVGAGYVTRIGLGFNARYVAGLSKTGDFDGVANANPDFKNSVVQLGLSFSIFNNR